MPTCLGEVKRLVGFNRETESKTTVAGAALKQ